LKIPSGKFIGFVYRCIQASMRGRKTRPATIACKTGSKKKEAAAETPAF